MVRDHASYSRDTSNDASDLCFCINTDARPTHAVQDYFGSDLIEDAGHKFGTAN